MINFLLGVSITINFLLLFFSYLLYKFFYNREDKEYNNFFECDFKRAEYEKK